MTEPTISRRAAPAVNSLCRFRKVTNRQAKKARECGRVYRENVMRAGGEVSE